MEGLFQTKPNTSDLTSLIKNGDYDKVGKYALGDVYGAIEKIFEEDR